MSEWKLFDGGEAHVSTAEFHQGREAVNHWEQPNHRPRMEAALRFAQHASVVGPKSVVDLGCGDGAMLQELGNLGIDAWGYDFHAPYTESWKARGVNAYQLDWVRRKRFVNLASVVLLTEVLEHLTDPHAALRWLRKSARPQRIIASSPANETAESHDACHAWAWDYDCYQKLFADAGWYVSAHAIVDWSQVVLAERL